jgi:hypothetical protein
MVAWIVNDLSLSGQFNTTEEFLEQFKEILAISLELKKNGHSLSCARHLRHRPVAVDDTCMQVAVNAMPLEHRSLALRWLTKGPYWTPPPEGRGIVYLHVEDVTDQGLGEAARRCWLGDDARTFSFRGLLPFEQSFLNVIGLRDGAIEEEVTSVSNDWRLDLLTATLPVPRQSTGWTAMLQEACAKFDGLDIAYEQIVEEMSAYPYDAGARCRLLEILRCLNELSLARINHGNGSPQILRWMETYVHSHAAMFSSESPDTINIFNFKDPFKLPHERTYCPWHGKVHNPLQYRVHYEWPVPLSQKKIKVLFMGQKLTKQ